MAAALGRPRAVESRRASGTMTVSQAIGPGRLLGASHRQRGDRQLAAFGMSAKLKRSASIERSIRRIVLVGVASLVRASIANAPHRPVGGVHQLQVLMR